MSPTTGSIVHRDQWSLIESVVSGKNVQDLQIINDEENIFLLQMAFLKWSGKLLLLQDLFLFSEW